MRRPLIASCVALTALLIAPPGAGAATQIGQTFAPTGVCGSDTFFQQASLGQPYFAPSSGVITTWAFQADSSPPQPVKFKVGRPAGGNDYKVVGTSASVSPTANVVNTYQTRIPVQAGDQIGLFTGTPGGCVSIAPAGNEVSFFAADLSPGDPTKTFTTVDQRLLDVSARLEPDADNDGYGDETQDCTPNDPNVHTGCRTAALRRCKKLARKHNWSHKRLRKCRKRALLLPPI